MYFFLIVKPFLFYTIFEIFAFQKCIDTTLTARSKSHTNICPIEPSVYQRQMDSSSILPRPQAQPNIFIINIYHNNFTRCNLLAKPRFKISPS